MDNQSSKPRSHPKLIKIAIFAAVLLVISVSILSLFIITDKSLAAGKVDDWQFKASPVQEYSPSYPTYNSGFGLKEMAAQLTVKSVLIMTVFTLLFSLIPLSLTYLTFRFLGFLVRRFRRELYFGTARGIARAFLYLTPGVISAVGALFLVWKYEWLMLPVAGATLIVGALTLLVSLVSLIYLISLSIVLFIKRLTKKSAFGLKRKWLWSLSIFLSIGNVIFLWAVINLSSAFYGIDTLSLNIPSAGGGNYSGMGSVGSSSFGGISNPAFGSLGSSGGINLAPGGSFKTSAPAADNIGYSTGGAKDINNFRENINNYYFPLSTDITYEGIFYDYYFDTGQTETCSELFCPSYSYAISKDPFSQKPEYYLSVGLNSGIKKSDFARKKLNLVIVMDISGSMSSPFYSYYYDRYTQPPQEDAKEAGKSKMQIANESVVALLNHLTPEDRFGMVLFDSRAYLAKPLRKVDETDLDALKGHILNILAQGSTNMEAGYKDGTDLFDEVVNSDKDEYENRIIFLTDAQPNTGDISESGLVGMAKSNSDKGIYTTFIGIGVDFNSELIEAMTKIKGANYYSVHSSGDFKQRMDDGFDYMVTPLVFDLALKLNTSDFTIDKVYGSPEADIATGQIMKVNTLFPSENTQEGVKGGIVILKLTKKSDTDGKINLNVSYKDRNGKEFTNTKSATLESKEPDFYQNTGIRKGILLARWVNLLKNWIRDERLASQNKEKVVPQVNEEEGIMIPAETTLSPWERTSVRLTVSPQYKGVITKFENYFKSEMQSLGDESLSKEVGVMDKLIQ